MDEKGMPTAEERARREYADGLRATVERIVEWHVAAAKAEAVKAVADEWQWGGWTVLNVPKLGPMTYPQIVTNWLRERADRIGGDA